VLGGIPLVLLASAFIVICCDPKLRDAEIVATHKRAGEDVETGSGARRITHGIPQET